MAEYLKSVEPAATVMPSRVASHGKTREIDAFIKGNKLMHVIIPFSQSSRKSNNVRKRKKRNSGGCNLLMIFLQLPGDLIMLVIPVMGALMAVHRRCPHQAFMILSEIHSPIHSVLPRAHCYQLILYVS